MDDTESEVSADERQTVSPSTGALERLVDPVVAVDEESRITCANAAARDRFGLPSDPAGENADALGPAWNVLESELAETAVGTVRVVAFEDERARIHRGEGGATITFDERAVRPDPDETARDRRVKDRAINEAPVGITISDPSREDNAIVYANDAFERLTGYPAEEVVGRNCRFLQGPDSDPEAVAEMREAIDAERPVTVELQNYRKGGEEFWNEVTIAPVRGDDGELTHYVGFQNDVTARKRAELEVERRAVELGDERAELERVLDRVEGLIQDVTSVVAGSTARSDLEAAVCDRIASEPAYDGAWIGERDPVTDEIRPRASANVAPDAQSVDGKHPAARAVRQGDARIGAHEGTNVTAFPLTYDDVEYGVLTVYPADARTVDDREEIVLSALARAVASGINARETSRILATDDVVTVELAVTDRSIAPVALSALANCRLEYHRSIDGEENAAALYTVSGASATDVEAATRAADGVEIRTVVDRDDGSLIELTEDGATLVEWFSDRGAVTTSIAAEEGRGRVHLDHPQSANLRSLVEAVEERYSGTDVVSFRRHERNGETRQEVAARIEETLTDRQFGALQRAYLGGYFEWPRPTTGEELAGSMGVSRPTFHEHLRAAERKLCRAIFEND